MTAKSGDSGKMRQEGEPSVEEILDSIKKVIARDNRESALAERRRRETAGIAEEPAETLVDEENEAEEVLELGESAEMIEAGDMVGETDDDLYEEEPEALMNAGATNSMRESLAALAMIAEPGAQPQIVRSGETSLEAMAREMLRPMLAQWLDANLPPMVEQMVKAEIKRIAGKKG